MPNPSKNIRNPFTQWWKVVTSYLNGNKRLTDKQITGNYGEHIAQEHLKQKGYQFIDRNYRCPFGEIDIIMRDNTQMVFVEVKTRNEKWPEYRSPEQAVDSKKKKRLSRLAKYYLSRHRKLEYTDYRFDIVSILVNQQGKAVSVNHITDAFYA
ncbi:MAG: YraN family protein [bacterium]